MELAMPARLELFGICKAYPAVVANDDISLSIDAGSIHAILGENGAGKSTLMKIIYGVVASDSGTISWNGEVVKITTPAEARELGIGMVFQHFSLFPALTVLDNLVLSLGANKSRQLIAETALEFANQYGLKIELDRQVYSLSVGEQQRVEILRCLMQNPKLLIMDEPTSVLTIESIRELFVLLRSLAADGCSIVYVSHKLHEVCELCDTATVLRRGRVVASVDPRTETSASLAKHMIGDLVVSVRTASPSTSWDERFGVHNLHRSAAGDFSITLININLNIRGGEILGIAGVAGNGQAELLEALSGEWIAPKSDIITIDSIPVGLAGPASRRTLGLAYIPEERLGHGAVPLMTLAKNALLTGEKSKFINNGLIRFGVVEKFTWSCIEKFGVKSGTPTTEAQSLSGGNLQKFIVGRELLHEPNVIIAAQPTWGLDVGAAIAIRSALLEKRGSGVAILLISEDLDELFEICDSITVISAGRLSPIRPVNETSTEEIGYWMAGHLPQSGEIEPRPTHHDV